MFDDDVQYLGTKNAVLRDSFIDHPFPLSPRTVTGEFAWNMLFHDQRKLTAEACRGSTTRRAMQ
jgi:hypothetical protein